jgi:4-hydroxy-2-oxoheptanedioate aldolase
MKIDTMTASGLRDAMCKRAILGTFITSGAPCITEIAALSGLDFIILDEEHGSMSGIEDHIRAAELRGSFPIVRVSGVSDIQHALDSGAIGIQIPEIRSAEEAREAFRAMRFCPEGSRGFGVSRCSAYGFKSADDLMKDDPLLILQCENEESLNELNEIAEFADVLFLGPYDMSVSLGVPGRIYDEAVEKTAEKILVTAGKKGRAAGIFVTNGREAARRISQGFRYIAISTDTLMLSGAYKKELSEL